MLLRMKSRTGTAERAVLRVVVLLAAALLPACRDSVAPEVFDPVGSLSFAYTGAGGVAGVFSASGALDPTDPGIAPVTVAGAFAAEGSLIVVAMRARPNGRVDLFTLHLGVVTAPGRLAIDPLGCSDLTLANCRFGFFAPDFDPVTVEEDPGWLFLNGYLVALDEVIVTSLTPLRVRGTFRGMGTRGATPGVDTSISVTNGTFDVPIHQN